MPALLVLAITRPDDADAEPRAAASGANPAALPGKRTARLSDATSSCGAGTRTACTRFGGERRERLEEATKVDDADEEAAGRNRSGEVGERLWGHEVARCLSKSWGNLTCGSVSSDNVKTTDGRTAGTMTCSE